MKVLLLAAGRSKRLKPIEDKNFLSFLGKPLIQHQIEQLASVGLKNIVVVGGAHNLGKLKKLAVTGTAKLKIIEQKNLDEGMAGAVLSVQKIVKNEPLLVVSANDVVDAAAYQAVLKASKDQKIDACVLAKKVDSYFPGGYLQMKKNGLITGIIEKPGAGKEPSTMVNLVVHFYRDGSQLIQTVSETKSARDDRYEVAMDRLMKQGIHMKAVSYSGFWQAIKYPWHVLAVMDYFLARVRSKRVRKVEIAKTATLRGNVFCEEGVRVLDNAVIVGPAYIGKNTVVASNAMVRGSHMGENCIIGFGSEVARSFLGNNVWTHTNYIGDSVIGNDVSFGAGTVTGNLRLDEGNINVMIQNEKIDSGRDKFGLITGDHVRCGINTSFMPGVKVGSNCFIGAGIVLSQDVEDNKYVYGRTELIMKENTAKLDNKKREIMKKKL